MKTKKTKKYKKAKLIGHFKCYICGNTLIQVSRQKTIRCTKCGFNRINLDLIQYKQYINPTKAKKKHIKGNGRRKVKK